MIAWGSDIPLAWFAKEAARIWSNESPDRTFPSPLTVKIDGDPSTYTVQSKSIGRSPGYTLNVPAGILEAATMDDARRMLRTLVVYALAPGGGAHA